jgi:dephospho-CoA kinase
MGALGHPIYVVGLTGGVGSGKSTAASMFAVHGAFVVDVDDISRRLSAPGGAAVSAIATTFPSAARDGEIDRATLRELVFASPTERKKLEAILHPMIRDGANREMESAAARRAPYVLLVVPLLFESNAYESLIACAIVVDVPVDTQISRVSATRGIAAEVTRGIVAAQISREERLKRAQFVLRNDADKQSLQSQVDRLHLALLANATMQHLNETQANAVV